MDKKSNKEDFRKLPTAAMIFGILASGFAASYFFLIFYGPEGFHDDYYLLLLECGAIGLAVSAIICGSIDLKRIKNGRYGSKGKGFDITGIILAIISILPFLGLTALALLFGG